MTYSNKKNATKYKRIFFITSIVIAGAALTLFLTDYTYYALGCVGVFSIWYLYFHVADYHFIEFSDENGKILLRFYKSVRFGKPAFNSIEFPQHMLRKAYFQNSIFGKISDLTLIVRTKRGMAEYPTVSLSAVPLEERRKIQESLYNILGI